MTSLQHELESLYDEYRQPLFTCALSVTRNHDLAEDAIHDAFCRLLQSEIKPRYLKTYVFRSVRNAAIDIIRKRRSTVQLDPGYIFDTSANPREIAEQKNFQQIVSNALLQLSEEERETIVQHLYADLTFREIAEIRECPVGTITSWYRRGISKMRVIIDGIKNGGLQ